MYGTISITNDCDGAPDGHGNRWILNIEDGEGVTVHVSMNDTDIHALYGAIEDSGIKSHIEEYRWHAREWKRMGPSEKAAALGEEMDNDTGYAFDDPKHPTYHDRMSGVWDLRDRG